MASAVKVALIAIVKLHYIDTLMASPEDCKSLHDVRREIDRLDEEVIRLLGQRARYVRAAARFKTSEEHVAAPERQAAMMQVRRQWAEREGLSADVVEEIYRRLVAYFIERERQEWLATKERLGHE
jgi:isochorismate pyruvate lyase